MQYTIDENGIHYYDLFAGDSVAAVSSDADDTASVIPDHIAIEDVKRIAEKQRAGLELCECRAAGAPTLCGGCGDT